MQSTSFKVQQELFLLKQQVAALLLGKVGTGRLVTSRSAKRNWD